MFYFDLCLAQNQPVKRLVQLLALLSLFSWSAFHSEAAFSSMYVFGDGICTTNSTNVIPSQLYFGKRACNGRIWIEVLAQWQGLNYDSNNVFAEFGRGSGYVVTNLTQRGGSPFPGGTNALFIVWAADADYINLLLDMQDSISTNLSTWTNAGNRFLSNHFNIITNLYAKNARTLVVPGAVDVTKIPYFSMSAPTKAFIRQRILDFNARLTNVMQQAQSVCPGMRVYCPDLCGMFDAILAQPVSYGFANHTVDALDDPGLSDYTRSGPGAYYVFWDYMSPSARAHMVIAELVQKMISPPKLASLTWSNKTSRIVISNTPVGRNGNIEVSTNLTRWSNLLTNFSSTSVTQTISVSATNSMQFYRVCFPFVWTWP
jgi:hypothetical protein